MQDTKNVQGVNRLDILHNAIDSFEDNIFTIPPIRDQPKRDWTIMPKRYRYEFAQRMLYYDNQRFLKIFYNFSKVNEIVAAPIDFRMQSVHITIYDIRLEFKCGCTNTNSIS